MNLLVVRLTRGKLNLSKIVIVYLSDGYRDLRKEENKMNEFIVVLVVSVIICLLLPYRAIKCINPKVKLNQNMVILGILLAILYYINVA